MDAHAGQDTTPAVTLSRPSERRHGRPVVSGASVQGAQVFGTYRVSALRQKRG